MIYRYLISFLVLAGIFGCAPSYSPDTYASNAAQQAAKVEQGVIVGVRPVAVSAAGTVGTVTGAAAGGIAGSQVGVGPISAFSALGGSLVGGLAGSTVEHVTADTQAFEYIVRKPNGDLVSVTQKDKTPLALGQKVLVIAGTQARVVPDYTVPPLVASTKTADTAKAAGAAKPADTSKPADAAKPDASKPADAAPGDTQPADAQKPADAQPADAQKPPDPKSADAKPPEAATAAAQPASIGASAVPGQPAAAAPDLKPSDPTKPADPIP